MNTLTHLTNRRHLPAALVLLAGLLGWGYAFGTLVPTAMAAVTCADPVAAKTTGISFIKEYRLHETTQVSATWPAKDKGYFISGKTDPADPQKPSYGFMARMNKDGTFNWAYTIKSTTAAELGFHRGVEDVQAIIELADGSVIMATKMLGFITYAEWIDNSVEKNKVMFTKLDKYGKEVWSRSFTANAEDLRNSLLATSDRGFLFHANVTNLSPTRQSTSGAHFNQPNSSIKVMKFDANGKLQWSKQVSNLLSRGNDSYLVQASDGGYVMAGSLAMPATTYIPTTETIIKYVPPVYTTTSTSSSSTTTPTSGTGTASGSTSGTTRKISISTTTYTSSGKATTWGKTGTSSGGTSTTGSSGGYTKSSGGTTTITVTPPPPDCSATAYTGPVPKEAQVPTKVAPNNYDVFPALVKFDSNFNVVWAKSLEVTPLVLTSTSLLANCDTKITTYTVRRVSGVVRGLIRTADNGYLVLGKKGVRLFYESDLPDDGTNPIIGFKYSAAGSLSSSKVFAAVVGGSVMRFTSFSAISTTDKQLMLVAPISWTSTSSTDPERRKARASALMLRTSQSLSGGSVKIISPYRSLKNSDVAATVDGGVLLAGEHVSEMLWPSTVRANTPYHLGYLMKLDAEYNVKSANSWLDGSGGVTTGTLSPSGKANALTANVSGYTTKITERRPLIASFAQTREEVSAAYNSGVTYVCP